MELQHFSHKHTLIFKEDQENAAGHEVSCFGCKEPVSGPTYSCIQCHFFLHKSCAECPRQIKHTFHRKHPLILHESAPYAGSDNSLCTCQSCGNICGSFFYRCSLCNFNLDIKCALLPCIIQPKDEQAHQFMLLKKSKIPYICDACGCDGSLDSWAYICTMCQLIVHSDCHNMWGEPTMEISKHEHWLTYTFFLHENESENQNCGICNEEIITDHGFYYCSECNYFTHFGCTFEFQICERTFLYGESVELVDDMQMMPQKSVVYEPMDTITRGIDEISIEDDRLAMEIEHLSHKRSFTAEVKDDDQHCDRCMLSILTPLALCHLKHFSHEHPLLFNIEQRKFGKQVSICFGCEKQVLGPSYSCSQCNLLLHETWAELPRKIKHPFHRKRPLILVTESPYASANWNYRFCYLCGKECPRFVYSSDCCEQFYLHIKCAMQPCVIDPQANQHQFIHLMRSIPFTCNACGKEERDQTPYFCTLCQVKVHESCISLPHTIKIAQHDHPLDRNYFFHENVSAGALNCGICHNEVNTEYGSYHCPHCTLVVHLNCALVNDQK